MLTALIERIMKRYPKCWWKKPKAAMILATLLPGLAFAEPTKEELLNRLKELPAEKREELLARFKELQAEELRLKFEQFQLLTNCQPVRASWMPIFGDPVQDEAIRALIEKRLRGAGIHDPEARNFLAVTDFSSLGDFLRFELEYNKFLHDPVSGHTFAAVTWHAGEVTVRDDFSGMLKKVGELTDRFIAAYLRVNERACD